MEHVSYNMKSAASLTTYEISPFFLPPPTPPTTKRKSEEENLIILDMIYRLVLVRLLAAVLSRTVLRGLGITLIIFEKKKKKKKKVVHEVVCQFFALSQCHDTTTPWCEFVENGEPEIEETEKQENERRSGKTKEIEKKRPLALRTGLSRTDDSHWLSENAAYSWAPAILFFSSPSLSTLYSQLQKGWRGFGISESKRKIRK